MQQKRGYDWKIMDTHEEFLNQAKLEDQGITKRVNAVTEGDLGVRELQKKKKKKSFDTSEQMPNEARNRAGCC